MMKNIEEYKNEIKKKIALSIMLCIIAMVTVILANFYLKPLFPSKQDITDYIVGFFTGVEIVTVGLLGYYIKIYSNEKLLKKHLLKENDEREILIRMKSGINIIPLMSMIIVIASFVVAYISYEAFVTMMVISFVQILCSWVLKIYWQKKI